MEGISAKKVMELVKALGVIPKYVTTDEGSTSNKDTFFKAVDTIIGQVQTLTDHMPHAGLDFRLYTKRIMWYGGLDPGHHWDDWDLEGQHYAVYEVEERHAPKLWGLF